MYREAAELCLKLVRSQSLTPSLLSMLSTCTIEQLTLWTGHDWSWAGCSFRHVGKTHRQTWPNTLPRCICRWYLKFFVAWLIVNVRRPSNNVLIAADIWKFWLTEFIGTESSMDTWCTQSVWVWNFAMCLSLLCVATVRCSVVERGDNRCTDAGQNYKAGWAGTRTVRGMCQVLSAVVWYMEPCNLLWWIYWV